MFLSAIIHSKLFALPITDLSLVNSRRPHRFRSCIQVRPLSRGSARRQRTHRLCLGVIALCCGLVGFGCNRSNPSNQATPRGTAPSARQSPLEAATAALASGDYRSAETSIAEHLLVQPNDPAGLETAGDIASALAKANEAIELYQAAVENSPVASAELYEKLGRQWMNRGSPYEAAEVLSQSVRQHPDNVKARADLAGLVASLGMVRDAVEHLRWLLRRGHGGLNELIMLADLNVPQTDRAICQYALKTNPRDLRPRYPLALESAYEGDFDQAANALQDVVGQHPDFSAAWALQGRALVELGDVDNLQRWQQRLPPGTDGWTHYWVAAGIWAERQREPELAARAFWEAVRRDDCHGEALTHLAANLVQLGKTEEAKHVARRAADVNAMHDSVESLLSWRRNSQQAALAVAEAMSTLGRPWEAEAWARASLAMTSELDHRAGETHRRLHAVLTSTTPWQLPESSVLASVDLTDLAAFRWSHEKKAPPTTVPSDAISAKVRFSDEASMRGLVHTTAIRKTKPEASLWIYQSNAGGAGVIDYDLDGWPDVYLTVLDGLPMKDDSGTNRIFRNRNGQFSDTTDLAGARDLGFSQGVAVGDYNADGFPDLLVANIGTNRLFRNNGDGTFADVTARAGLSGNRWTTSVAIADIDSDGIDDLFEVNYAAGQAPYTQSCIDGELNEPRSCSPLVFPAESDRVWRNLGDGTFTDASDQWLPDQVAGHGLGLVLGHFDTSPGIDVYVANDMTANQFWSAGGDGNGFSLREQAAVRGLAVNSRSKSQASMGIAIGDADSDGDLDILLTHFTDDYNTLYEQIQPGTWFDRTSSTGLAQPSTNMLAFGTEWIDADNSGTLELLVANGNVDDFRHQGHPLRMPPQFFARTAGGVWQQGDPGELGPYFQRRVVGRALVTLDLNRDGLQDAIITHLFDPVAALVNQTETESRSIRLFLKGRHSSRDAVGTIVRAKVNDKSITSQLTAGDGFQCSNQRCVTIGLDRAEFAKDVSIQWPSGESQEIGDLRAGNDYLVMQGAAAPFRLDSPE